MQRLVVWSIAFAGWAAGSAVACSSGDADDGIGGAAGNQGDGSGGNTSSGGGSGAWQGATPHLELSGTVADHELVLEVSGDAAADLGTVYCERNYIVPDVDDPSTWSEGYLQKVEFKLNFFYENALAELQMELENPDLMTSEGATFAVPDDAEVNVGLATDVDGPNEQEFEDVATGGAVTLELFSGEMGDDGVIPDGEGAFGAYVDVELASGGSIEGSFTVNCGENDLEVPE